MKIKIHSQLCKTWSGFYLFNNLLHSESDDKTIYIWDKRYNYPFLIYNKLTERLKNSFKMDDIYASSLPALENFQYLTWNWREMTNED